MHPDKAALLSQLSKLVVEEPIPPRIRAIFFGICEMQGCPQVYVSGSTTYDPDDADWACWTETSWIPRGRYLRLDTIGAMSPAEWQAVEQSCIDLLQSSQAELAPLLGPRPVAAGWDEGDLTLVFGA